MPGVRALQNSRPRLRSALQKVPPPAPSHPSPPAADAGSPLTRALDGLAPTGLEPDVEHRARLVVAQAVVLLVVSALYVGLLAAAAAWAVVPLPLVAVAATLGALVLLRTRRLGVETVGRFSALMTTALVFAYAAMTNGLATPELVWLGLVPFTASGTVGTRFAWASAGAIGALVGALAVADTMGALPSADLPGALLLGSEVLGLTGVAVVGALVGVLYGSATRIALARQRSEMDRLAGALRTSEARYRELIDHMPVGVAQTRPDGHVLLANDAFAQILGYASTDELTDSVSGHYAIAEDRARLLALLQRDGVVRSFETTWTTRAGDPRRVRIDGRAVRHASGAIERIEGVVRDATAEWAAQKRLQTSEARFRALVQHASDLILVVAPDGTVTYASPATQSLVGRAPDAITGRSLFDVAHPDEQRRLRVLHRWAATHPGTHLPLEARIEHAEGHFVYVEVMANDLGEAASEGTVVLALRDVTERKRAEAVLVRAKEQAEEVARLKSTFLANMSHEIRTPLTGILGFASILAEEVSDPQQAEFVDLIESSGRRLLDTLNSVLDLARLEAGHTEIALEDTLMREPVEETVRLLRALAAEKGLALDAVIDAPDAAAELDAGALDRVLTNLVGNAIKFTEQGGIRLTVRADAHRAYIDVADTGVGIDPEFLPHLFEEFQQESSGAQRSHEGSGLGLAITRQLVHRMGGEIGVRSVKGQGTTFTVAFPRVEVPPPPVPRQRARVLVVDDNEATCMLAERMLDGTYRVDTAMTAEGAIGAAEAAAAAGDPYEVLLLDINLGAKTSGEDVMRRLRSVRSYQERPIIAFTAYALPGDRERFLSSGFDGYFPKPFTRKMVLDTIAEHLGPAEPVRQGRAGDGAASAAAAFVVRASGTPASDAPPPAVAEAAAPAAP